MQANKSPGFQAFAKKLTQILWDSHDRERGYGPNDDLQNRKRRNPMQRPI